MLLEKKELLGASVYIGANVIPGVCGVMLLNVGPSVRQVPSVQSADISKWISLVLHFTTLRADIGKGVQDMGQFVRRQILGVVVAAVDCLYPVRTDLWGIGSFAYLCEGYAGPE